MMPFISFAIGAVAGSAWSIYAGERELSARSWLVGMIAVALLVGVICGTLSYLAN
jgi:hypothetical protein